MLVACIQEDRPLITWNNQHARAQLLFDSREINKLQQKVHTGGFLLGISPIKLNWAQELPCSFMVKTAVYLEVAI